MTNWTKDYLHIAFVANSMALSIMMFEFFAEDNKELIAFYSKVWGCIHLKDGTAILRVSPQQRDAIMSMRFDQVIVADSDHDQHPLIPFAQHILNTRMSGRVGPEWQLQFYSVKPEEDDHAEMQN